MQKYNHNIIGAVFTLLIITLLASCSAEGPCKGTLVLTNPISDVTVAVGDTVFIDLSNPPVFVSSKGRVSYFYNIKAGVLDVNLNVRENPINENSLELEIVGRRVGVAIVELLASASCMENSYIFNITITES
jgi:hypothetical protein